jgi:hypothetical protein
VLFEKSEREVDRTYSKIDNFDKRQHCRYCSLPTAQHTCRDVDCYFELAGAVAALHRIAILRKPVRTLANSMGQRENHCGGSEGWEGFARHQVLCNHATQRLNTRGSNTSSITPQCVGWVPGTWLTVTLSELSGSHFCKTRLTASAYMPDKRWLLQLHSYELQSCFRNNNNDNDKNIK